MSIIDIEKYRDCFFNREANGYMIFGVAFGLSLIVVNLHVSVLKITSSEFDIAFRWDYL